VAQILHADRPSPKRFNKYGPKLMTSSWVTSLTKLGQLLERH